MAKRSQNDKPTAHYEQQMSKQIMEIMHAKFGLKITQWRFVNKAFDFQKQIL